MCHPNTTYLHMQIYIYMRVHLHGSKVKYTSNSHIIIKITYFSYTKDCHMSVITKRYCLLYCICMHCVNGGIFIYR